MIIYLGADHGGFELKEKIKTWLREWGYEYKDMGAEHFDPTDDYPDFVFPVADKVSKEKQALGIILGRSGNGEAILANKLQGVRAAVCLNVGMARKTRDDNNANVLVLGGDYLEHDTAKKIVKTFLETPFSQAERHIRRLAKIEELTT